MYKDAKLDALFQEDSYQTEKNMHFYLELPKKQFYVA